MRVCVYVGACGAMGRVGGCARRVHMHCGVKACGVRRVSASVCMCVCRCVPAATHTPWGPHPGGPHPGATAYTRRR